MPSMIGKTAYFGGYNVIRDEPMPASLAQMIGAPVYKGEVIDHFFRNGHDILKIRLDNEEIIECNSCNVEWNV